jgi:hypothetical protein
MSRPGKIAEGTFRRMARTTVGFENMGRNMPPIKFRQPSGDDGGSPIRLGQFTGSWYNEPGISGADNLKLVKLYVQSPDASGPTSANDWIPELDGNGDEVIAVTLNLFSYIPTRSGNDSSMWCAVIPLSDLAGEYWTGSYEYVEGGPDVPIMRPYSKLWLLLAAEC